MAQSYFPFDSGAGGSVTEAQWGLMAKNWLKTGVLKGILNEFQVYADSTGMQVKVKNGNAWIQGYFFQSDAEVISPIATADPTNPRIDRVVLRVDWTANTITIAVLQGVPASSPAAPAVTQNSAKWEISLAQVRVDAAVATIAAAKVTDERTFSKNFNVNYNPIIPFTLQNGWITQAANWQQGYYIDDAGFVEGWAMISSGTTTNGTAVATLPVGYRPVKDTAFPMTSYNGSTTNGGRITVNTAGAVQVNENAGSGWVIIHFRFSTTF